MQQESGKTVVGQNIPHDSARGHVSGESVFIDDMRPFAGELVVGIVGSPAARGELVSIQMAEALALPGVRGIYRACDLKGHNLIGAIIQDEPVLAERELSYLGQPVAIIAATDRRILRQARMLIKVEARAEKPVLSIAEARAKDQILGWKRAICRGDAADAIQKASHRLQGKMEIGGQEQFYLESQAALAVPGENGQMTVYSSTQHTTEVQTVVAEALGLPFNQVVCICKRMGGAFGGKESQAGIPAALAALAAQKTGRPARLIYDKDLDMQITGKRHPYEAEYEVGFSNDGMIQGIRFHFYSNGGAFADLSTSVLERTMLHADNAYFLENVEIFAQICRTNLPPNTAFRGFGGPQGVATIECIIEEIAIHLGLEAFDVRLRNCYGLNDRNIAPYGQIVREPYLRDVMERLRISADYDNRRSRIRAHNASQSLEIKAISMSPVKFGISFTSRFLNQANALVNLYMDGTIQVSTGATEMGQGVNTKLSQVVAQEFGLDAGQVIVMPTSTEKNNNTSPTAASAGMDLNGFACLDATVKIKQNLSDFAAGYFASTEEGLVKSPLHIVYEQGQIFDARSPGKKVPLPEMVRLAYRDRINLGARGFYATPGVDFNRETGKGSPFLYYTNGAALAEVAINRLTGRLRVEQVDILMDLGEMINPGIDRGQVTGGFIQGMGWVTTEELVYSAEGALVSHSPTTYKIPNIQDTPAIFNVDFVQNSTNVRNVARSKAVGEPPLLLGIAVWSAVKNGLQELAGKIVNLRLPATGEEILRCLSAIAECSSNGRGSISSARQAMSATQG